MKRFLLWDYPRAVWQYDVMVAIILAFVFLTPRDLFRDQPRAYNVVMLPSEHGAHVFWIEPELLDAPTLDGRLGQAASLLRMRTGRTQNLIRLEPIFDAEKDVKGYMAYTKP
jgi:hypothetical protein